MAQPNLLMLSLDDIVQNPILAANAATVQGRISVQLANANAITLSDGNMLIIIDNSGSMGGNKIRRANEAVSQLVDTLPDGTKVLIIYFSSGYDVIEFYDDRNVMINDPDGSVIVDQSSRKAIKSEIMNQGSRSATYFSAPHDYGLNWLLAQKGPKFAVTGTDGHSSDPSTDDPTMQNFATKLGSQGIDWYIAGIGGDYNFQALTSWAAYADGRARVIHVDDAAGLTSLLDGISKKVQRAVFSDFAVTFLPVQGVQALQIIHLGTPPVEIPVNDANRYKVEHQNAGAMDTTNGIPYIVKFLFEQVPTVGAAIDVARVQVFYTDASGARVEENLMLQVGVTNDRDLARNFSQTAIETMQKSGVQATFSKAVNMMTVGQTMLDTASTQADRTAAETMIQEAQTMLQSKKKAAGQVSKKMATAYDSFLRGVGGSEDKSQASIYTQTVMDGDADFDDFISGQGGNS